MLDYSVVIPAHDEEERIGRAVAGALGQTLRPREIIVVDDGSTDRTAEVASGLDAVRVVRLSPCRGPSAARNVGIEAAAGAWVALLDSDDAWVPDKVARQAEVLSRDAAVGLVYCGVLERFEDGVTPDNEVRAKVFPSHRALRRELMIRNCITGSGSGVLIRRDLLAMTGGFDAGLQVCEDWDLWMRLALVTEFAAVPEPLVTLFKRPESHGGEPQQMFEGEARVLAKNAHLFDEFPGGAVLRRRAEAARYLRRASILLLRDRYTEARRDFESALRWWPLGHRAWIPWLKLRMGMTRRINT